jgi:hypothetical protein
VRYLVMACLKQISRKDGPSPWRRAECDLSVSSQTAMNHCRCIYSAPEKGHIQPVQRPLGSGLDWVTFDCFVHMEHPSQPTSSPNHMCTLGPSTMGSLLKHVRVIARTRLILPGVRSSRRPRFVIGRDRATCCSSVSKGLS